MDKKIVLLSSCFLLFMAVPVSAGAEVVQTDQKIHTQQQLKTDLARVKQQKLQVQDEIEATQKKIAELNHQLKESTAKINSKRQKLSGIHKKLERLNKEDQRITALLNSRKEEFKDRAASYYRTEGQMSFLNVLFSVNSFGDFIDHFVAYNKIVKEDKKFIEAYIADQNRVTDIKTNVKALQASTIREKADLEALKLSQVNKKKEKEKWSVFLKKKKKQLEKEEQQKQVALELLQKNVDEILAVINKQNDAHADRYAPLVKSIISPFVASAQKLQEEKGVPASITLGQIILESSGSYNGLSGLAYKAKNLFGIKGTGTNGSVYWPTIEYVNGKKKVQKAKFARYKTFYDSMAAHANLLLTPRYQQYLRNVTSIVDYANGLVKAGYATDPEYATKLLKIIYQYDLWKLDV